MRKIFFTLLASFILVNSFYAQPITRYNTFSYNVNEGLLQSTMADIAIDKNNFCWISFPIGIQKFDGEHFTTIPVQPGLPDNKAAYFFICRNGDLLISHAEGISKYEIDRNAFTLIYKNEPTVNKSIIFIGEDEGIIYFYTQNGFIKGINGNTYKLAGQIKINLPVYPSQSEYQVKFSSNIINHKVAITLNYKLYHWNLKKQKLMDSSAVNPDISINFLQLKTADEVLYYSTKKNNTLIQYNFLTKKNTTLFVKGKDDKQVWRRHNFTWKNKRFQSINNRIFETDSTLTTLKTELVDFQNQAISGIANIANIKEDNFGNLYIQTINGGLKKVIGNNYPVKYYGSLNKEDNIILSLLPDKKNNRVLIGTAGSGVLVFDTLQRLIKHIKTLPGKSTPFLVNAIVKKPSGDYLLFAPGEKNGWVLKNDLSTIAATSIISTLPESKKIIGYFGNILFQNKTGAITQTEGKLYRTNFAANTVYQHEMSTAYIMGGLLHNNFIITHGNDELIFLDTATFTEIKRVPFINTGYVRCFAHDTQNNIFIGSNNGIYEIDENGKILKHLTKQNGLPDNCIYAMVFDENNDLWCSTNKGIFRLNKDNSIFQLKKEDGLQENEFNTNVVARADDGELFFGGVNGVSSFYPAAIGSFNEKINLFFTGIKINNEEAFKDTAVWNITDIDLPYHRNSLSFDFIAMANNNPGQYVYQYKMEGIDKGWIQNTDLQTVRYFLPPGKYIFKIYASRFFDKDAKPMKEIRITIYPPFYKTWWFVTSTGIILLSLMGYTINRYNRRKYLKKLAVLEGEQKIKSERERISRDLHDSIGAYANAVLYNTELLENEKAADVKNDLMKDLKFASKDIITALRETIWALKKDNYTAEDCLLRIRNFVQPFARYYPHMQFKIEGQASSKKILPQDKALSLVRIVQEAVTNAIKHSEATNICIYSISNNDDRSWELIITDDGKGFSKTSLTDMEDNNGLHNMKQRAVDSMFELNISSEPGAGTKIIVKI